MRTAMIRCAKKGVQFLMLVVLSGMVAAYLVNVSAPPATPFPRAEAAEAKSDIDLRYFRVELEHAKKQLENALDDNKHEPGAISSVAIDEMRLQVGALEEMVKDLETTGHIELRKAFVLGATTQLDVAKIRLKAAIELRKTLPDSVSDLDVEELQLAVKAAELAVEKVQSPEFIASEKVQRQWYVYQLGKNVLALRVTLAKRLTPTGLR